MTAHSSDKLVRTHLLIGCYMINVIFLTLLRRLRRSFTSSASPTSHHVPIASHGIKLRAVVVFTWVVSEELLFNLCLLV